MSTFTLNTVKTLAVSGRYANPENENDILPEVYGDMGLSALVAPCIDTLTFVYCAANHEVLSEANGNIVTVSDDDGERSDATFYHNTNYEGQGVITAVQLLTAANGSLVVSFSGKVDSTGALIENPVDIILDLVSNVSVDVDTFSFAKARIECNSKSYKASGVIMAENTYNFWINSIMGSFLGDWWVNNAGKLKLRIGNSSISSLQVAGFLVQRRLTQIGINLSVKNIVNQAVISYKLSYAKNDKRYKEGVQSNYLGYDDGELSKDTFSQSKYGIRKREFGLDWIQDATTAATVQAEIIALFKAKTYIVDWQEYEYTNIHVEEGDFVTYSCEDRRDENGDKLVNQIAQVLKMSIDLDTEKISFTLKDLGQKLTTLPDIWDGNQSTGDGGTFGGAYDTRIIN